GNGESRGLIVEENDPLDCQGLASWLASTMNLTGLIVIREGSTRRWQVARRQIRRDGWWNFANVLAFRVYSALLLSRRDGQWKQRAFRHLLDRFHADLSGVARFLGFHSHFTQATDFLTPPQPAPPA